MIRRLDGYFHTFLEGQHIKVKLIGVNWCVVYINNNCLGEGPFDRVKKRLTEVESKDNSHQNICKFLFNDLSVQI